MPVGSTSLIIGGHDHLAPGTQFTRTTSEVNASQATSRPVTGAERSGSDLLLPRAGSAFGERLATLTRARLRDDG